MKNNITLRFAQNHYIERNYILHTIFILSIKRNASTPTDRLFKF